MPLHPDARRTLDHGAALGQPALETLSPAEARANFDVANAGLQHPAPEVAEVRDMAAAGAAGPVRLRFYRGAGAPEGTPLPAMVYFHGGGWVLGGLDSHDVVCRRLANEAKAIVVAVDYALAPERKFPGAVEDAAAGVRYVFDHAAELDADVRRVAAGGDSAGGNLAAVTALMARDGTLPPVQFQALIYPVTDLSTTQPSYTSMAEGYGLTTAGMRWFGAHYLRDAADAADWRASPLTARSLAGAAPAYVATAYYDPLCDEALDYVAKLRADGVAVTHRHFDDQIHGFVSHGRYAAASGTLLREIAACWTALPPL